MGGHGSDVTSINAVVLTGFSSTRLGASETSARMRSAGLLIEPREM